MDNVTFLGHIVSKEGIFVDPKKGRSCVAWERPTNVTKIKNLLGLAGYYRQFVEAFSMIISPLSKLIRKYTLFEWTIKCEQAFQELKRKLTTILVLALPPMTENCVIYSDASR